VVTLITFGRRGYALRRLLLRAGDGGAGPRFQIKDQNLRPAPALSETALAKVNLTPVGRWPGADGFHDLESGRACRLRMPKHRIGERLARFRHVALEKPTAHHDALEFANGEIVLVNRLILGQIATVLQLPKEAVRATAAAETSTMRAQGAPAGPNLEGRSKLSAGSA
jgi:hypothetical protein